MIALGSLVVVLALVCAAAAVAFMRHSPGAATATTAAPTQPPVVSAPPTRHSDSSAPSSPATAAPPAASSSPDRPPTDTTPSGPHPVRTLGQNPLFASTTAGLANIPCPLSRWGSDQNRARQFFASAIRCLDAVWSRALSAAGLPFASPHLVVGPLQQMRSPCEDTSGDDFAAFYCSANRTVYLPLDRLDIDKFGAHPGVYLAVAAHEYGHHVQTLSGVMDAMDAAASAAGRDSETGRELSRRLELQAQCFSGMFVGAASAANGGSVDRNLVEEAWSTERRGDGHGGVRDHGSDEHSSRWWQHGATTNRLWQCNTWIAEPSQVS